MGLNAASDNKEAARVFLEWMTTPEFAELYANALPGFFPLSNAEVTLQDPLAQEFLSWREECESTIRSSYQILSRGEPNNENQLWNVSSRLLNGEINAEEAGSYRPGGTRDLVRTAAGKLARAGSGALRWEPFYIEEYRIQ